MNQMPDERQEFTLIGSSEEKYFPEGPHSRWHKLLLLPEVIREFFHGFRKLYFIGRSVNFFGSAHLPESNPYCPLTRELTTQTTRRAFMIQIQYVMQAKLTNISL